MLSDPIPSVAPPVGTRLCREVLTSAHLGRDVELSILLPPGAVGAALLPVLYLNDGQDLERLHLQSTLDALYASGALRPFVLVAPHANEQRVQEYGTATHPDFNGRGSRAGAYTNFIIKELLPFAQANYHASADPAQAVMAGFSLGGLSAVDMVWHHPEAFARAGAFSGSFWWRQRAVGAGYTPADRIMHGLVRARRAHPSHGFWLQSGTLDERNDRNENGVIDSIEDCLDLMEALIANGLDAQRALRYVQVEGGHHHPDTWGRVMPDFLRWAFGSAGNVSQLPAPLPVVRLQLDPHLAPEILLPTASAPAPVAALLLPTDIAASPAAAITSPTFLPSNFMSFTRPADGDFLPYALGYINQIPADLSPHEALRNQPQEVHAVFAGLSEAQAEQPYADGKWSLKEMLLHQIDSERIFAYRALRFARADGQDLRGFEQDDYVAHSGANARSIVSLLAEYDAVRAATVALFDTFGEEQLGRRGTANGGPATVRALLYIIPGHERHHLNIVRERYLPMG